MIEFEPMKKEHIGGLKAVEEECFNSGYAEKTFLKELENKISFYIVAKECEKIVSVIGYCKSSIIKGTSCYMFLLQLAFAIITVFI